MVKEKPVTEKVKEKAKKINRENAKKVLLSESMTPKQKYIILGLTSVLIALGVYVGIVFILNNTTIVESNVEDITLEQYVKISLSKKKQVVYVATKNSETNKKYEEIVMKAFSHKKTSTNYLDLGVLSEKNQVIDFMNVLDITKDTYTEPMLLVFEDEKLKDSLIGVNTKTVVIEFLEKNRIE